MHSQDCSVPGDSQVDRQVVALDPNVIKVGPRWRQRLDREGLENLKESIRRIGVKVPISVRRVGDEWHLVAGQNRLNACQELGLPSIPVREEHGTDTDALMWEISENLHRIELTALERDRHLNKWTELCEQKLQSGQVVGIESKRDDGRGHRHEGAVTAAARELGIDRKDVERAQKVASLSDEAQQEAVKLGLDDNRDALLKAAKHKGDPDAQVQALRDRAAAKAAPKPAKPKPPATPATPEPREPASQARAKAIVGFSTLLHQQLAGTLDDLTRMLRDERGRITEMPLQKRLVLARGYLHALGVTIDDLRPVGGA